MHQTIGPKPQYYTSIDTSTIGLASVLTLRFSEQTQSDLELSASARQFSSMMVMVGTISSATSFEPKHAAIVQNKDELTIPLELSTIPTPKEFKDATRSLSERQKAFAKMFREMQLASTLFGVLVVQIKPAIEQVLNLPPDSLTKEIRLTQDLMELFIDYQIPTDLLKHEGRAEGSADTPPVAPTTLPLSTSASEAVDAGPPAVEEVGPLASVKAHVASIRKLISEAKRKEVEDEDQKLESR